jgi:hypothetical protein
MDYNRTLERINGYEDEQVSDRFKIIRTETKEDNNG